jgi:2-polyprenyl-3-methyl-5-hydroxy-6-metoxy-1,4-benzoquinol methylase
MPRNESLKDTYNKAYSGNKPYAGAEASFFTFSTDDVTAFLVGNIDFGGKTVLEVGCGTGETAAAIAGSGAASVLAVDYADEAIKSCKSRHSLPNLQYRAADYHDLEGHFDVVVLQEVIEHLDNPSDAVRDLMGLVRQPGGRLVVTCPNFTNLRGHVWMTLQLLFDVPMSLTDLHFLSPFDLMEIAEKQGLSLEWTTFAHDRVYGEKLLVDMRKRLTNALRDAAMDNSKVERLIEWLDKSAGIEQAPTRFNGGKGFYVFTRPA